MTSIHHLLKRFKFLSFVPIAFSDQDPIPLSSLCYYPELLDRTPQSQLVQMYLRPLQITLFFYVSLFICLLMGLKSPKFSVIQPRALF